MRWEAAALEMQQSGLWLRLTSGRWSASTSPSLPEASPLPHQPLSSAQGEKRGCPERKFPKVDTAFQLLPGVGALPLPRGQTAMEGRLGPWRNELHIFRSVHSLDRQSLDLEGIKANLFCNLALCPHGQTLVAHFLLQCGCYVSLRTNHIYTPLRVFLFNSRDTTFNKGRRKSPRGCLLFAK